MDLVGLGFPGNLIEFSKNLSILEGQEGGNCLINEQNLSLELTKRLLSMKIPFHNRSARGRCHRCLKVQRLGYRGQEKLKLKRKTLKNPQKFNQ